MFDFTAGVAVVEFIVYNQQQQQLQYCHLYVLTVLYIQDDSLHSSICSSVVTMEFVYRPMSLQNIWHS